MYSVKQNSYKIGLLQLDKKHMHELFFIMCLLLYELFSIVDILIRGVNSIQWRVLYYGYDFIADYTNVIGYSSLRDPYNHTIVYGLHEKGYPPLQYCFSYLLSNNTTDIQTYYEIHNYTSMYADTRIMMLYIILTVIAVVILYESIRRYKNGSGFVKTLTAIAISLSFPIIFTIERGNSMLFVIVFIMIFICFYDSKNKILCEFAFLSLALAAALKLTPAILGVILIMQKKWKEAVRTILYGIAFFILPFLFLKGGIRNFSLFLRNLSLQLDAYKEDDGCNIMGYILRYFAGYSDSLSTVCTVITVIICFVLMIAAFYAHKNSDRLLYLCLIMLILPAHSATYCILYLIPVILAVLNESSKKKLDIYIIIGGCLCCCELGGYTGFFLINHYNGVLIILLCALIRAIETLIVKFKRGATDQDINLLY